MPLEKKHKLITVLRSWTYKTRPADTNTNNTNDLQITEIIVKTSLAGSRRSNSKQMRYILSGSAVIKMITAKIENEGKSVGNDEKLHEIHKLICYPIYFTPVPQTPFRHQIASKDFTFFPARVLWVQEMIFSPSSVQISVWNPWTC